MHFAPERGPPNFLLAQTDEYEYGKADEREYGKADKYKYGKADEYD